MRYLGILTILVFFVGMSDLKAQDHHEFKELNEKEISYEKVPSNIKQAFQESEYKNWEVKGAEEVETDQGTMYEIEVAKEGKTLGLYFDKEGKLRAEEEEGTGGNH